jgi:hypothetical protein
VRARTLAGVAGGVATAVTTALPPLCCRHCPAPSTALPRRSRPPRTRSSTPSASCWRTCGCAEAPHWRGCRAGRTSGALCVAHGVCVCRHAAWRAPAHPCVARWCRPPPPSLPPAPRPRAPPMACTCTRSGSCSS